MPNIYVASPEETKQWDLEVRSCFSPSYLQCLPHKYSQVDSSRDNTEKEGCVDKALENSMKDMNQYIQEDDSDRDDDNSYESMYSRFRIGGKPTPKYSDAHKKINR